MAAESARRGFGTLDLIIALMGLVLMVAGVWLYEESGLLHLYVINLFNQIENNSLKMGWTLLGIAGGMTAIGFLMLAAAVCGMCGACKRNRPCIVVFLTLAIFLVLFQVVLIAMTISYYSQTDSWLRGKMMVLLKSYDGPFATDDISEGWNSLFRNAKCCAVNDQYANGNTNNDFTDVSATWTIGTNKVPATCCQGVEKDTVSYYDTNSGLCTSGPTNYYENGCWDKTRQLAMIYLIVVCSTCVVAIFAEVASIVLGCGVADKDRHRIAPGPAQSPSSTDPSETRERSKRKRKETEVLEETEA